MSNNNKKNNLSDREVVLDYIGENKTKPEIELKSEKNKKEQGSKDNIKLRDDSQQVNNRPPVDKKKTKDKDNFLDQGPQRPAVDFKKSKDVKPEKAISKNKASFKKNLLKAKIEAKVKLAAKKKTKQKTKRQTKKSSKDLKPTSKINPVFLKNSFWLAIKILLASFVLFLLFYLAFVFLVLGFSLDTPLLRKTANFLPVPGLITPVGVIDYYTYRDLSARAPADKLVREMVVKNVLTQYGLQPGVLSQAGLDRIILSDREINKKALAKIAKIKALAEKDSLKTAAQKSGAKYGIITLSKAEAVKRFGPILLNLSAGQISPLIIKDRGYYLVQIISRSQSLYTLSYAFVKGIGWQDYIDKQIKKVWFWQAVK